MNGQVVILNSAMQRTLAKNIIDKAPLGAVANIGLPSRSSDQNSKLWAMPGGRRMTPDVWKAVFMNACGHAVQFEAGLSGEPFPIGFRSSRLTKPQMGELIDFIDAWGTEQGVVWSEPRRAA